MEIRPITTANFTTKVGLDHRNRRLWILSYHGSLPELAEAMYQLAHKEGLGKVLIRIRPEELPLMPPYFIQEGRDPSFFRGRPALYLAAYPEQARQKSLHLAAEDELLRHIESKKTGKTKPLAPKAVMRVATPEDATALAALYAAVFASYPTPHNEPAYLRKIIGQSHIFRVIEKDGHILSAASVELDPANLAAETTDCATLPAARGQGYLSHLLTALEADLRARNYITAFSLARAKSFGMNLALLRQGYSYCGRLINNCHIAGQYEDMNIWSKRL